jgi:thioredoxin 1
MEDLNTLIGKAGVVLVDCWAEWCPHCVAMMPQVDALGEEMKENAEIVKVNVSEKEEFASQFNITSLPTFLIFKDGNLVEKFNGSTSAIELKQKLSAHI